MPHPHSCSAQFLFQNKYPRAFQITLNLHVVPDALGILVLLSPGLGKLKGK
jgi:hypothetical protein